MAETGVRRAQHPESFAILVSHGGPYRLLVPGQELTDLVVSLGSDEGAPWQSA